jgi:transposase
MSATRIEYDEETKRKIAAEKVNGVSLKALKEKYNLKHDSLVYNWVKKYYPKKAKTKASTKPKKKSPNKMATAIVLLNHARDAAIKQVKETPERFDDPVYGLAMMALRTLEGKNDHDS